MIEETTSKLTPLNKNVINAYKQEEKDFLNHKPVFKHYMTPKSNEHIEEFIKKVKNNDVDAEVIQFNGDIDNDCLVSINNEIYSVKDNELYRGNIFLNKEANKKSLYEALDHQAKEALDQTIDPLYIDLADRYNDKKPQYSLIDFKSLEPMVRVLEFGAKKYSKDNWKKGLPVMSICDSLLRHLIAFMNGENNDKESKQSHIGHILCNAMFLQYVMDNKSELDDRFNNNKDTNETIT